MVYLIPIHSLGGTTFTCWKKYINSSLLCEKLNQNLAEPQFWNMDRDFYIPNQKTENNWKRWKFIHHTGKRHPNFYWKKSRLYEGSFAPMGPEDNADRTHSFPVGPAGFNAEPDNHAAVSNLRFQRACGYKAGGSTDWSVDGVFLIL